MSEESPVFGNVDETRKVFKTSDAKNLTQACENALLTIAGWNDDKPKGFVPEAAELLAHGIREFLTKQTFTVTEFKAAVELDSFETSMFFQADIGLPYQGQTASWPGGSPGPLQPVTIPPTKGVVKVNKINFTKDGSSAMAGNLTAVGYAYINSTQKPPVKQTTDIKWNNFTKVQLNPDEIVWYGNEENV